MGCVGCSCRRRYNYTPVQWVDRISSSTPFNTIHPAPIRWWLYVMSVIIKLLCSHYINTRGMRWSYMFMLHKYMLFWTENNSDVDISLKLCMGDKNCSYIRTFIKNCYELIPKILRLEIVCEVYYLCQFIWRYMHCRRTFIQIQMQMQIQMQNQMQMQMQM